MDSNQHLHKRTSVARAGKYVNGRVVCRATSRQSLVLHSMSIETFACEVSGVATWRVQSGLLSMWI